MTKKLIIVLISLSAIWTWGYAEMFFNGNITSNHRQDLKTKETYLKGLSTTPGTDLDTQKTQLLNSLYALQSYLYQLDALEDVVTRENRGEKVDLEEQGYYHNHQDSGAKESWSFHNGNPLLSHKHTMPAQSGTGQSFFEARTYDANGHVVERKTSTTLTHAHTKDVVLVIPINTTTKEDRQNHLQSMTAAISAKLTQFNSDYQNFVTAYNNQSATTNPNATSFGVRYQGYKNTGYDTGYVNNPDGTTTRQTGSDVTQKIPEGGTVRTTQSTQEWSWDGPTGQQTQQQGVQQQQQQQQQNQNSWFEQTRQRYEQRRQQMQQQINNYFQGWWNTP